MKERRKYCGNLRRSDKGHRVYLAGWIHRVRSHKGLTFVDLRDRSGIVQLVAEGPLAAEIPTRLESCVEAEGQVRLRREANPDLATGEVEVLVSRVTLLSDTAPLPFHIHEESREDLRLRYRYLDLRSASMQEALRLRHEMVFHCRSFLHTKDFYEIETPTMIRSTPEGARDFLVPSRNEAGSFYALAQSPQLYKQMLMIGGFERYFQIARCYRDEDTRGDRQPEHSQIDIEMSFVDAEIVQALTELMLKYVMEKTFDVDLTVPFPRLKYRDAMNRYGSDKPDLRFDLPLQDFDAYAEKSDFAVFKKAQEWGGTVKLLAIPDASDISRKDIEGLEELAKQHGAKGLAWTRVAEKSSFQGGIARFLSGQAEAIVKDFSLAPGALLFFAADSWETACRTLGAVRAAAGKSTVAEASTLAFAWVVDFPLFTQTEEGWEAEHHMFTQPKDEYVDRLEENPAEVVGELYDLTCNGYEIASGSMRIHNSELQQRIFDIVGLSKEEAARRFGFFLEALRYAAPPHGGIALGLDRLVMLASGRPNIREVIAFPKNTEMASPLDGAPAEVPGKTLKELGITVVKKDEKHVPD